MVEDGETRNGLTTHAARNQAAWDASSDEYQQRHGAFLAASGGLVWCVMLGQGLRFMQMVVYSTERHRLHYAAR